MADRSPASGESAGAAAFSSASRWTGTAVGEVIVAAAPGTKVNPVIAPPVLTVTSAVACFHHGFLTDCTETSSPSRGYRPDVRSVVRIDWTRGSPGLSALAYSTAASVANWAGAPTIHCRNTSLTSAAWPSRLLTGSAQTDGKPCLVTRAAEPVYFAQLAGELSSPCCTTGFPFDPVTVAP